MRKNLKEQNAIGKKSMTFLWALIPFVVVILLYEILPLITVILNSFSPEKGSGFTLDNFKRVFTTPLYTSSITNSLKISLISAAIGIVIAFIAGNAYDNAGPKFKNIFTLILNMTSNFAGVPLAFAFMLIMGNTGILTIIGKEMGIGWLANFDLYTGNGLLLVYIYFQIP